MYSTNELFLCFINDLSFKQNNVINIDDGIFTNILIMKRKWDKNNKIYYKDVQSNLEISDNNYIINEIPLSILLKNELIAQNKLTKLLDSIKNWYDKENKLLRKKELISSDGYVKVMQFLEK